MTWQFGIYTILAVGVGYCFGRAHAVWIQMDNLTKSISATLDKFEKEKL